MEGRKSGKFERLLPELERYGQTTMEATEILFFHDSQTILSLLSFYLTEEQCFLAMLKMTDIRLNHFNPGLEAKEKLLQGLQLSFKREFNSKPRMIKSLSIKYRSLYPEITKILDPQIQGNNILNELVEKNSFLTLPIIEKIKDNEMEMAGIGMMNYLTSLLHMNINRMFRSEQRVYEMLLYDFLYQYYNSQLKRIQKS